MASKSSSSQAARPKSDIEIARAAKMLPVAEIGATAKTATHDQQSNEHG